jgi:hypothetical protein
VGEVKQSTDIITYFYIFFICFIHHFSSFCFYNNNNQLFSSSLHIFALKNLSFFRSLLKQFFDFDASRAFGYSELFEKTLKISHFPISDSHSDKKKKTINDFMYVFLSFFLRLAFNVH